MFKYDDIGPRGQAGLMIGGVVVEDSAFPMIILSEEEMGVLKLAAGRLKDWPYLCFWLRDLMTSPDQGQLVRSSAITVRDKICTALDNESLDPFMRLHGLHLNDRLRLRYYWIKLLAEYNEGKSHAES